VSESGTFRAEAADAGRRLDVALAERLRLSRAAAQRLIAAGLVLVEGSPARKRQILHAGETVAWRAAPPAAQAPSPAAVPLSLVYEDDWVLVVDKPAGVVVHPAPGHEHGTLADSLAAAGARGGDARRPGIVHRLDKDTSGLLVVARREDAYRRLVAAMKRHLVQRTYAALLLGSLAQDEGTIDAPVGRHVRDRRRMALHSPAGKRAVTHFETLARAGAFTLVRVRLETGRTHQIRVHFAALGHPVAGDLQYGRSPRPEGLGRQFLHAARLTFPHPDDGHEVTCSSPLPDDLAEFLESLGLADRQPI